MFSFIRKAFRRLAGKKDEDAEHEEEKRMEGAAQRTPREDEMKRGEDSHGEERGEGEGEEAPGEASSAEEKREKGEDREGEEHQPKLVQGEGIRHEDDARTGGEGKEVGEEQEEESAVGEAGSLRRGEASEKEGGEAREKKDQREERGEGGEEEGEGPVEEDARGVREKEDHGEEDKGEVVEREEEEHEKEERESVSEEERKEKDEREREEEKTVPGDEERGGKGEREEVLRGEEEGRDREEGEGVREEAEEEESERLGFFSRLVKAVTTQTLSDAQFDTLFEPIALALLEANVAFDIVERLREALHKELVGKKLKRGAARSVITTTLHRVVEESLLEPSFDVFARAREVKGKGESFIILFLGPNGAGKTTTIAKLAFAFKQNGLTPVIAAADTFRAAALEQVETHAERIGVRVVKHDYGADPAAVAFDAVKHAKAGKADVVLIDTAGRLQTNENLLREVEKIKRVVKPNLTLLVVESTAGSDAVEQARVFDERIGIDGFILTKADADELGGTLLSVSAATGKPIFFLGVGQGYEDLIPFEKEQIIRMILGEE